MSGLAAAVIEVIFAAGRGPADLFAGLFQAQGGPDWPHGVQEADAPRFALEHAEALRPGSDADPGAADPAAAVEPRLDGEIIELFNRRLPS